MKVPWAKLVLTGSVLLVAAIAVTNIIAGRDAAWEARVEGALDSARVERARADSALSFADSVQSHADSIVAAVDARAPEIRERVRIVRETVPVPDTCRPVVAQRDSLIDELTEQNDQLRIAYTEQRSAAEILRASNLGLVATVDSLMAVLEDRPQSRRWLPEIRIGPQVGVGIDGKFHAGVGLNIGWKIPVKLF